MLSALRNASGSLLAKLLLGLLVLSFAVWGISGQILGGRGNNVMTAGDTNVSILDYRLAYDRQVRLLSQQFNTHITREQARAFGIDQQVLAQLMAGALLDEQAREMRLGLSADRLAQLTAEDPAFRGPDGSFNRQQFEFMLRQIGMRPQDYFRNREQVAKRQQIVEAVSDGLAVPDTFLTAVALHQGEGRTVEMITLPRRLVEPVEPPADAELQAWFAENQAAYVAPEYRTISYMRLDPEAIAAPADVAQEDVEAYYRANQNRYTTAERRRIEQIVFPDQAAAEAALERIRGGEEFETIAAELGRSAGDLELGTFEQGQVPDPRIAEAAFALEQGEISDVVQGSFGPLLVRVTQITPQAVAPLADVEDEIRQEIALDQATDSVMNLYAAYEDARGAGDSMQEAAAALQLEVVTVEAVDSSGLAPDGTQVELPESQQLLAEAFEAEPEVENPPINVGTIGFLYYEVDAVTPSRERALDEVREQAVADWTAEQVSARLTARADELVERVAAGESLTEIADELGLSVEVKRGLNRNTNDVDLGRGGVAAVFGMPQGGAGAVEAPDGGARIVFVVTEVSQPLGAGPDSIDANQRNAMASGMSDDLLDQLVARLQGTYRVQVNESAIQQALSF